MNTLHQGFAAGYAYLSARADLLDRINVFPVADSDTGANLRISLSPLRSCGPDRAAVAAQLVRCATGNSGNIAASFFSELLTAESLDDLPAKAAMGRDRAWQAVAAPLGGTMLSVFDCLADVLARSQSIAASCETILDSLQKTVLATAQTLPDLRSAGVVDSGALGMYVFFDGFFRTVTGHPGKSRSLAALFPGHLTVAPDFNPECSDGHCVDAIIQPAAGSTLTTAAVAALGESVVVIPDRSRMKIHIHTTDPQALRTNLASLGEVVGWSDQPLHPSTTSTASRVEASGCLHIMTDAAGSLPRALARQHDITLLDSYIVSGDTARPESLCAPETVYALMREGHKVTTAQASHTERHHLYGSVCEQFGRTLYLCVGSAFTGNHDAAVAWKREHDSGELLEVFDTGAASGRLALMALLVNRLARRTEDVDAVLACARRLVDTSREYIFIDTLRHLVAGGRVSRTSGFFGDLLHRKPVVSQTKEGVRPVGTVRNRRAQLDFALNKVRTEIDASGKALLLLQYSDNRTWVAEVAKPQLQAFLPKAEMILTPLSLTSGVHMGPGTWALAFAPVD